MFAKKLLRVSTLVLSAVLVGAVGFSIFTSSKKLSAAGDKYYYATGVNTLTGDVEDFKLVASNGGFYFCGYYGNRVTSSALGIPEEFTIISGAGSSAVPYDDENVGAVVSVIGIADEACKTYPINKLAIPYGVESIGKQAFQECKGLVEVSFPSTLKTMGRACFKQCELLKVVDLSQTSLEFKLTEDPNGGYIHHINGSEPTEGKYAFEECIALQDIKFPKNNDDFMVVPEGFCKGCRRLTSVSIPDSVHEVDQYAFQDNVLLESVRFSSNLVGIDAGAFKSCSALTSVKIPSSVEFLGQECFYECTTLSSATLADGIQLEKISKRAFKRTKLQNFTIPASCDKLYILEEEAFMDCTELATFTVKTSSIHTFDKECFSNCSILKTINIPADSLTGIGEACFKGCTILKDIASKSNNIIKNVVNIGPSAFYGCEAFTEFYVPDITTIGEYTFYGCKNIVNLYFSSTNENDLDKVGDYAFAQCAKMIISGGKIPDTVTVIGKYAFSGCTSATSIGVPSNLEKIDEGAFKNCTALKSFTIPSNIDEIRKETFYACASLKSIAIPDEVTIIPESCFTKCVSLESVKMGNQVVQIQKEAFSGCTSLCHGTGVLSLSSGLTLLDESAFFGCSEIKSVSIPSGVSVIPAKCFAECSLLKNLNLNNVTEVGQSAFEKCSSLATLNFPAGFEVFGRSSFRQCTSLEVVVIPDSVNQIPDNCFNGCTSLEYVKIPDSVTALGRGCFSACNLLAVELPDSLLAVSSVAFDGNRDLNRVTVSNNKVVINEYLGSNANVEVPEKIYGMPVVEISAEAYRGTNVKWVHVPSSVKKIGDSAFEDCKNLLTVRIPNTIRLTDDCFSGCQTVYRIEDLDDTSVIIKKFYGESKTVNIPNTLESKKVVAIGDGAFKGNIYIQDVTVPKSVTSIGAEAFMNCSNAYVLYPAAASVGKDAFKGCKGSESYGDAPTITQKPTITPTPIPGKDPTPVPGEPSIADFIERLYTVALDRPSDASGKAYWVREITNGNKTGADCARGFLVDTPEFQNRGLNDDKFVETLYQTFFGRASEASGKAYWMGRLKDKSATRLDVILNFIDSKEWCNICADYGVKSGAPTAKAEKASKNAIKFATRLYTECLGRDPETAGLNYWSLALTNLEQTGYSAAKQFFTSKEFRNFNTTNEEYVTRLYTTFMGREPEADGFKYWVGELNKGADRDYILAKFASTPEFANICKSYGIDRGDI